MITMPESVTKKLEFLIAATRTELETKPEEQLLPVAFMYAGNRAQVSGFLFRDQVEKEAAVNAIAQIARNMNADTIVTRAEAWCRAMTNEEADKFVPGTLAGYEGRNECVMFVVETKDHCWTGTAIIDNDNGKKTMREVQWTDQASGMFTSLLRTFH